MLSHKIDSLGLSETTQTTVCNRYRSCLRVTSVTSGGPLVTDLEPFSFIIFVNDTDVIIWFFDLTTTQGLVTAISDGDGECFQEHLGRASSWSNERKITFNISVKFFMLEQWRGNSILKYVALISTACNMLRLPMAKLFQIWHYPNDARRQLTMKVVRPHFNHSVQFLFSLHWTSIAKLGVHCGATEMICLYNSTISWLSFSWELQSPMETKWMLPNVSVLNVYNRWAVLDIHFLNFNIH